MKHISLFSGIGGFDLGIPQDSDFKTSQFVEINPDAQAVLSKWFPHIPIQPDICTYHPAMPGGVYSIGFPCTGTSAAGSKTGLLHEESKLWFEALRCINEGKPEFIIVENPVGLLHNGLRDVLGGLRVAGYSWDSPQIISLDAIGSPQKRARIFIIAYPDNFDERYKKASPWHEQIRTEVKRISATWRKTESGCMQMDDEVPDWLGGNSIEASWGELPKEIAMRSHTPKRREAISLYARSVCPTQAAFAWRRVQYLRNLEN